MSDRFTTDVLREAFFAVTDEMFESLKRTSQSPVIYEVLDFAVGLTDARGELVSQGNGIAGFLGPLGEATRDTLVRVPDLAPGDVVATNDPYAGGGGHLSDVAMVRPIFVDGELVAFAAAKGHWTEVGGKDPGSWTADSVEIFQEGLQLPFVRVARGGELDRDLVAMIGANSRLPDMTIGDLTAFAACLEVAERRVLELCRRYGVDDVTAAMAAAHDAERGARPSRRRAPAARRVRGRGLHRRGRPGQRPVPDPRARRDRRRARRRRLHGHPSPGAGTGELHAQRARLRRPNGVQGDHGSERTRLGRVVPAVRGDLPARDDLHGRTAGARRALLRGDRGRDRPSLEGARAGDARGPDGGKLRLGVRDGDLVHAPGHGRAHAARRAAGRRLGRERPEGRRARPRLGRRRRDLRHPGRGVRAAVRDPGRAVRVRRGRGGGRSSPRRPRPRPRVSDAHRRQPDRRLRPPPVSALGRRRRPRRLAELRRGRPRRWDARAVRQGRALPAPRRATSSGWSPGPAAAPAIRASANPSSCARTSRTASSPNARHARCTASTPLE